MEPRKFRILLQRTLALPMAVMALLAGVLFWEANSLYSSMRRVDHSDQVISSSRSMYRLLIDMETGERGYLLTGGEEFLQPYRAAKHSLDSEYVLLRAQVRDDLWQQARLDKIHQNYSAWENYAESMIALRKEANASASSDYQANLDGKNQMDAIRGQIAEFIEIEERLRTQRSRAAKDTWRLVAISSLALVLGAGLLLALLTRRQIQTLASNFQQTLAGTREAESALRVSEERYRWLFDNMIEALAHCRMVFDDQGAPIDFVYLEVNPAFTRITGFNNVVGRRYSEVFPALRESNPEILETLGRVVSTGRSEQFETEVEALRSWFSVSAYRTEERSLVIIFDNITERKQAEEALRASEERWAITLQSIADAVISTDTSGKIVFMNDVAQTLTGCDLAYARGTDLGQVFHIVQEVTRIRPESPVEKVLRTGSAIGMANHSQLIRRDGSEIPIEVSAAPIRGRKGRIEGVVLVFHDVSAQRRSEQALRNSERLATTGRLAATIAHEIHNPLDTVGNLLFLMTAETKEEKMREYVELAAQELSRVTELTQQMLSFQRDAVKPAPVKIREIIAGILKLYERKIRSAHILIDQQVEFEGEIMAMPGELRQVLSNLIGNAIDAIGPHLGRIRLRARAASDWRRGKRGMRVVVADNGPGIPDEIRQQIFDPFFTTKGESGTGLGLFITSDIVRKYGGAIRLRSTTRNGRSGTCFSIFFPLEAE